MLGEDPPPLPASPPAAVAEAAEGDAQPRADAAQAPLPPPVLPPIAVALKLLCWSRGSAGGAARQGAGGWRWRGH